jgi:hypothetical protein
VNVALAVGVGVLAVALAVGVGVLAVGVPVGVALGPPCRAWRVHSRK